MLALSTSIMDEIAKDKEVEEQIRTGLIAKIESCFDTTLICYLFNGNNDSNNMTAEALFDFTLVISFVYSYETGWLYLFGAKSTTACSCRPGLPIIVFLKKCFRTSFFYILIRSYQSKSKHFHELCLLKRYSGRKVL
ncbi:Pre-mRNA-splicing factor [Dirofilaria immitis]